MPADTPLIDASDICVTFRNREILRNVDLSLAPGEILTLIGPNGAGKTTLIRVILGLLRPDKGRVTRRPGLRIGYMPQRLTVAENLPLSVERFLHLTGRPRNKCAPDLIRELGIAHLLEEPMQVLSGGEHQRVLLARALQRDPDLLVLDEPLQGVDVAGQAELYRMIVTIRDLFQCGVLMISHDLHLVMAATDRVLCLNRHVCCAGHPESVSRHPAYLELFGTPAADRLAVYTHHHDHSHDIHGNVIPSRASSGENRDG